MSGQHLDRDRLRAFVLGTLPEDQLDDFERQIIEQGGCDETLLDLDQSTDLLLERVKAAATSSGQDPTFALEPECQRAVARALEIRPAPPSDPTHSSRVTSDDLPAHELMPLPAALGQYRLVKKLGEGGMGTVYQAVHPKLDKQVAVKILPSDLLRRPRALARFEREMKAIGKLEHPQLVRATDAGEDAGIHYLVTEYVDGIDLGRLVDRLGPLPIADCAAIGAQVARGLDYIRRNGLVHRDIKPSNLMLTTAETHGSPEQGQVKILDLGLARLQSHEDPSAEPITDSGEIMGTIDYIAPEQAFDPRSVDIRADLYSLGCTLYRLLTGRPPFSTEKYPSTLSKLSAHKYEQPLPMVELRPEVPAEFRDIVNGLMAKDPAERFQTPGELASQLKPFAADSNLAALLERACRPQSREATLGGRVLDSTCSRPAEPATFIPLEEEDGVPVESTTPHPNLPPQGGKKPGSCPGVSVEKGRDAGRSRHRLRYIIAANLLGLAGLGIIYQVVIVRIKDKQGRTVAEHLLEPGSTVDVVTEPEGKGRAASQGAPEGRATEPSTDAGAPVKGKAEPGSRRSQTSDAERRAAEWVLSLNGTVTIEERGRRPRLVSEVAELPQGHFVVVRIDLWRYGKAKSADVTDAGLAHLESLASLKTLYLGNTVLIRDDWQEHSRTVSDSVPPSDVRITDAGLKHLRGQTSLTALDLQNARISDAGLEHLEGLTSLEILSLDNTRISDAGLEHLKGLPNLSTLFLSNTRISNSGLGRLKGLTSLTSLGLESTDITDAGLETLKDFPNLQKVVLGALPITDAGLKHLRSLTRLTHLLMYNNNTTDAGIEHLKGLTNLGWLSIGNNRRITDASVRHLKGLANLRSLKVSTTSVTDACVEHLVFLSKLKRIVATDTRISKDGYDTLRAAFPNAEIQWSERHSTVAEHVFKSGGLVNLLFESKTISVKPGQPLPSKSFDLVAVDLTAAREVSAMLWESLSTLEHDGTLESLNVSGTTMTDGDLGRLGGLKSVSDVSLAGTKVTDAGLAPLKDWKKLRRLDLDGTLVSGPGLVSLAPLDQLAELRLGCPKLSGSGLRYVARLGAVRRLSLAGSGVGDMELMRLAALNRLEHLDLTRTRVTAGAVAELQRALPKCKIVWDGTN